MSLIVRYTYLKDNGKYIATRHYGSFSVHLYQCGNFYVEAWTRVGSEQVSFIEPVPTSQVAENYLSDFDPGASLGL